MFIYQGPYKIPGLCSDCIILEPSPVDRKIPYINLRPGLPESFTIKAQFWSIRVHFEVSATQTPLRCRCGGAKTWMLSRKWWWNIVGIHSKIISIYLDWICWHHLPFLQKSNHLTRGILKFLIFLWAPISYIYIAYRLSCIGLLWS